MLVSIRVSLSFKIELPARAALSVKQGKYLTIVVHFYSTIVRIGPQLTHFSSIMPKTATTQIEIVQEGDGKTFAKVGDNVTIHYVGTLQNGKKFDSSRDRGSPFRCQIGVGRVIKGWDFAIPQLSVGTRATLTIPSDEAYGDRGFPPMIPPSSTLVFDVELLRVD